MVLLPALSQKNHLAAYRILHPDPLLRILDALAIEVDATPGDEPSRLPL